MIGYILEYSKLDLREAAPPCAPLEPAAALNGLLKTMRPLFRAKGIAVALEIEPDLMLAGDEVWLRMAFKNLLENAARYTPEAGEVLVALRSQGDRARVEVTNSAAPVGERDLARIFDPFYRGQGAPSEGTGLGLAITRKIIRLHGGDIGALNTPQGFQVWLWLPQSGGAGP